jgi:hypothetical protein
MKDTAMVPLVFAVTIGGIAILHAVALYFLPGWTRRDVYFAVTVYPGFRDSPDGRIILRRYRIELTALSGLTFTAALAGIRLLGAAFFPAGFVMIFSGSFAAFYRARRHVRPHAMAPTTIREADLHRGARGVPGGWVPALGPFLLVAACAAFLWIRGREALAGFYFLGMAGMLAAFSLIRHGISHWARSVHSREPEVARELQFRRTVSVMTLVLQYLIAIQASWVTLMPHGRAVVVLPVVLILTCAVLLVLARLGQGGSRLTAILASSSVPVGDRTEDRHWRLGVLYFNPDDAAVIVEKRFGLGYTFNFARLTTWIIMSFLLLSPLIHSGAATLPLRASEDSGVQTPSSRANATLKRYRIVVSVAAGSGVGSRYISQECPADSLRFAAIHFRIASCASFIRLYGPRWTATAASPAGVSVGTPRPQFQMCA